MNRLDRRHVASLVRRLAETRCRKLRWRQGPALDLKHATRRAKKRELRRLAWVRRTRD